MDAPGISEKDENRSKSTKVTKVRHEGYCYWDKRMTKLAGGEFCPRSVTIKQDGKLRDCCGDKNQMPTPHVPLQLDCGE